MKNKDLIKLLSNFPDDAKVELDPYDCYIIIYYGDNESVYFSGLDMIYKYNKTTKKYEETEEFSVIRQ